VLGVLLGIFPFLTAISNGYLLGFASKITAESQGLLVLWRLIPHGIFELPAIIISTGIGIKLGISVLKNWNKFKFEFTEALRFFVFVLLPLFLIAAIIEGLLIFFI
jgi:stage II sporulation protein M